MRTPREFAAQAAKATENRQLRNALSRASVNFRVKRTQAMKLLPDFAGYQQGIRQARMRSLAEMPALLEKLEQNLSARGVKVHWAEDAAQAREIISGLTREYGTKSVVKGKSMITEEIALNPALEAMGIDVCETDLGEYIIQLAGEPPSHIIAPAVHKSRQDVTELFLQKLGETADNSVALTAIAREALRERFLKADMGITGVNMAIADPGVVVLVENEGNIRMSTTCPRVHVAVMSLEKVVAGLDEAAAILQMLPRSATGQKLSSYVSMFSSARLPDEVDGPEHMHLVILDNGRSRMLADPELRETLLCVRCGACLAACSVYRNIGGHSYGWAYSGPIGSLLGPQLLPPEETRDYPQACAMCGNCHAVCPVGIDHPAMLLTMRRRYREDPAWGGAAPLPQRAALDLYTRVATRPGPYRAAMAIGRCLCKLDPEMRFTRRLPGMNTFRRYAAGRTLPCLRTPFYTLWRKRSGGSNG